jgi:lipoyl(octanoyl) transferase
MSHQVTVRRLGLQPYTQVLESMRAFTDQRDESTADELWMLEHEPVFTLGQAGRMEHVLAAGSIPVIKVERGGQVTYHGPGQIVAYPLFDLRRLGMGVRELVNRIEQAIIDTLEHWNIVAVRRPGAPGVYVGRRQDRRTRIARAPRLLLPRPGLQRADGPGAVRAHQPLRLSGAGG